MYKKIINTLIKNHELKLEYIELDKERCDPQHIALVIECINRCIEELKKLLEV